METSQAFAFRDMTPIMEDQMEKTVESEMETGLV